MLSPVMEKRNGFRKKQSAHNIDKAPRGLLFFISWFLSPALWGQVNWQEVSGSYGILPAGIKVYQTATTLNQEPFRAFYVEAHLNDRSLAFRTDTTNNRRINPSEFYIKNARPVVVVNTSFFSFQNNRNLNLIMDNGRLLAGNQSSIRAKHPDSLFWMHTFVSALGIRKNRSADVAWTYTDSSRGNVYAAQLPPDPLKLPGYHLKLKDLKKKTPSIRWKKWKMQTIAGGGPVLIQDGRICITHNEERKFSGKALYDKHPRTAMGYTRDGRLILLAVEGRNPGISAGATLAELAEILHGLGCIEALNLDGGGSSCLLVNGNETIKPSDKSGQRPIPGILFIAAGNQY